MNTAKTVKTFKKNKLFFKTFYALKTEITFETTGWRKNKPLWLDEHASIQYTRVHDCADQLSKFIEIQQ